MLHYLYSCEEDYYWWDTIEEWITTLACIRHYRVQEAHSVTNGEGENMPLLDAVNTVTVTTTDYDYW